jgi:hypothetical protein
MNIITHETERIHQLQRQLQEAEQFRALVRDMRRTQRRYRNREARGPWEKYARITLLEHRNRLEACIDMQLRLLDSE